MRRILILILGLLLAGCQSALTPPRTAEQALHAAVTDKGQVMHPQNLRLLTQTPLGDQILLTYSLTSDGIADSPAQPMFHLGYALTSGLPAWTIDKGGVSGAAPIPQRLAYRTVALRGNTFLFGAVLDLPATSWISATLTRGAVVTGTVTAGGFLITIPGQAAPQSVAAMDSHGRDAPLVGG